MIITIDGPSGSGKSTIAKLIAKEFGFTYFDTGAMYRATTYSFLKNHVDIENLSEIGLFLESFEFDIRTEQGNKRYFVGNEDVTEQIRSREVTNYVSKVAAIGIVRKTLVKIQKKYALNVSTVFEGRDMGTVVFPNANVKIFITASAEVRAKRRHDEIQKENPNENKKLSFNDILESIKIRDHRDMTREISPLKQADDAYGIDTSDLSIDQVVEIIIEYVNLQKST